jgi:hypothetical protein
MGTRGPVPKREAERRRTNEPTVPVQHVDVDVLEAIEVKTPEPDEHWHPVVRQLWDSFLESGQRFVLEPTDWALLFLACEDLTRELKPRKVNLGLDGRGEPILVEVAMPIPGGKLQALNKLMGNLLATEGDRRRLGIEIDRAAQKLAGEKPMPKDQVAAQRKKRLGKSA